LETAKEGKNQYNHIMAFKKRFLCLGHLLAAAEAAVVI